MANSPPASADFRWADDDGVRSDLAGVITPTAEIHEHARGELFAVDRGAGHDVLLDNGATFVVDDLAELLPERPGTPVGTA